MIMDAIRIKNLRSLKDTELKEIKPITILVGKNGSGKSTFLRTFQLFKQSTERRTKGPILWWSEEGVDFGSYKEAVYQRNAQENIDFGFAIQIEKLREKPKFADGRLTVDISIGYDKADDSNFINQVELSFYTHILSIKIDSNNKVVSLNLNNNSYHEYIKGVVVMQRRNLLPRFISRDNDNEMYASEASIKIKNKIMDKIRHLAHGNTGNDRMSAIIDDITIGDDDLMLNSMREVRYGTDTWYNNAEHWNKNSYYFKEAKDLIVLVKMLEILPALNDYLCQCFGNVKYVYPIRAIAERYYRTRDLSVDEIDPMGRNMHMFLKNLTKKQKSELNKWLSDNFYFELSEKLEGGHITFQITESSSNISYNIADMGFGFSQILPVIINLWYQIAYRLILLRRRRFPLFLVIEQPELHLHPSFQAMLADVFVKSISLANSVGIDLRIIFETHSDTIVNRIGHNIFKQSINCNDVSVLVFEKNITNKQTDVNLSYYDDNGYLVNWPVGFFDMEDI